MRYVRFVVIDRTGCDSVTVNINSTPQLIKTASSRYPGRCQRVRTRLSSKEDKIQNDRDPAQKQLVPFPGLD